MARPYTVEIPGGGQIVVNANSPEAARENAGIPGAIVHAGGYQSAGPEEYGGPPSTGPSTPSPVGPQQTGDMAAYFNAIAGFDYDQLAQNDAHFKAQLQLERDRLERLGIPQLALQQRLADLEDAHFKQQMALARQAQEFNQGITAGQVSGTYNGAPTEAARQFNANLGLSYLSQAAQFAASDPFALSDFQRGAQLSDQVPVFLRNLRTGVTGGTAGAVGPEARPATTLPMLAGAMGGDMTGQGGLRLVRPGEAPTGTGMTLTTPGPAINPQAGAALGAIGDIYRAGPDKLAAGSLESLDTNERNTLGQGIRRLYGQQAVPAFLEKYYRNPFRSQSAASATSLAY